MRVELSPYFEGDLNTIAAYIAKHNPTRAMTFVAELRAKTMEIGRNPYLFRLRPELGPGTRVMPVGNYMIAFRILDTTVMVDRVLNSYRDLAAILR